MGILLIGADNEWSLTSAFSMAIMILFVVWMTNLYNFMDGINGLAALEAISICLCMAFIYWLQDVSPDGICL